MTLPELIEALEKADRPDRRLDWKIYEALRPTAEEYAKLAPSGDLDGHWYWMANREYTASVDAAIALCGRVLPGAFWMMSRGRLRAEEPLYAAQLLFGSDEVLGEAEGDCLPIALCLATLRAKLSQEKNNAAE